MVANYNTIARRAKLLSVQEGILFSDFYGMNQCQDEAPSFRQERKLIP
jgi:hypothetical protein